MISKSERVSNLKIFLYQINRTKNYENRKELDARRNIKYFQFQRSRSTFASSLFGTKVIVFFLLIGEKLVGYLKQNQNLYKSRNHETKIFLKLPNYKNYFVIARVLLCLWVDPPVCRHRSISFIALLESMNPILLLCTLQLSKPILLPCINGHCTQCTENA